MDEFSSYHTSFAEAQAKNMPVRGWEQINPTRKGSVAYLQAKQEAKTAWDAYNAAVDRAEEAGVAGELLEWPESELNELAEIAKACDARVQQIWDEENGKRVVFAQHADGSTETTLE